MQFAGVIFASLVFVLMIGIVEIADLDRFGSTAPPDSATVDSVTADATTDGQEQLDCEQLESDFAAKLERSRSCNTDTDCSLARFECPFECIASISTTVLDDMKREERSFQQQCNRCESSCPDTLIKWRAACVRQRCIMLDRSIEELEDETLRLLNESS